MTLGERDGAPAVVWDVPATNRVSAGMLVGGVAAAATTGALIAMGHRGGSIDLPFAAIGSLLLRRATSARAVDMIVAGFLVHVAAVFVCSLVCAWLVARQRWRILVAAIVIAAAQFGLSSAVTWASGRGLASVLPLGDRIVFFLVLATSLGVGMRFAFFSGELHHRDSAHRDSAHRAHPL